jgi:hypothetical protein
MKRGECLDQAKEIIHHDRNSEYGEPEDNFADIGSYWTTFLRKKLKTDAQITPAEVAIMSALIKISRLQNTPTYEDGYVDIAGYAACGVECATESGATLSVLDLAKRATSSIPAIPAGFVWHNNRLTPEAEMEGVEGYDRHQLPPEEW